MQRGAAARAGCVGGRFHSREQKVDDEGGLLEGGVVATGGGGSSPAGSPPCRFRMKHLSSKVRTLENTSGPPTEPCGTPEQREPQENQLTAELWEQGKFIS